MNIKYRHVVLLVIVILTLAAVVAIAGDTTKQAEPVKTAAQTNASVQTPVQPSAAAALAGEQIKWQVISAGGTDGSSASYHLRGTAGQVAVGTGSSASYVLGHGFWQPFGGGGGCCQQRGDINDDGVGPDISDLVDLVSYMFGGQPYPGCEDPGGYKAEADIDGNGTGPDISDLVALVNYMFGGCPGCLVPCP